jgi:nucleotide-binding universal stress UspA family protein
MKVLIAADGSACSRRAQEYVAAHPELFDPKHEYTVLNIVPEVPPHAAAVVGRETVNDYYKDEAEKVLNPIHLFFEQKGYKIKTQYKHGHSAEGIAEMATRGEYDLLVMGSHGHSALGNLVMGSVTTKVLAHCKTPILIVR